MNCNTTHYRANSSSVPGDPTLIWEAFNLTNRPNYTVVDNTLYTLSGASLVPNPLFGRRLGQADGRIMQFAARLIF